MKKIVKTIGIAIGIFVILFFSAIGITLNFVFTPEKITPAVNRIVSQFVETEATVGRVDLTFFSSFPRFSAQIDSLTIKNKIDSMPDFIAVKTVSVSFNPLAILKQKIDIGRVLLENPEIYIFADSAGSSLGLFRFTPDTVAHDTSTTAAQQYELVVDGIKITGGKVTVDDRTKQFYTQLSGFNFDARGGITDKVADLSVATGWENLLVWQADEVLLNHIALSAESSVRFNRDSMLLDVRKAALTLNGIDLVASGRFDGDTLAKSLTIDMNASLATPSLGEFLAIVPTSIIPANARPSTSGSVALSATIKGVLSSTSTPLIDASLDIKDAKASYKGKKVSIDEIDCKADLHLNLNRPEESFLNLPNLVIKSSGIVALNATARVDNLLKNPALRFTIDNEINFSRLTELFPLEDGVVFKGKNNTLLSGSFRLSDLKNAAWNNIHLDGNSLFTDLVLSIDGTKRKETPIAGFLFVEMNNGKFLFGNSVTQKSGNSLTAEINFSGLGFKDKSGKYLLIKELTLSTGSKFKSLKKEDIEKIYAELTLDGLTLGVENNVDIRMSRSKIALDVSPPDSSTQKGTVSAVIKTDSASLFAKADSSVVRISSAGVGVTMTPKQESKAWDIKGDLGFAGLHLYTNLFPIAIHLPSTEVRFSDNRIALKNARLNVGTSNMVATGYIDNLVEILFGDSTDHSRNLCGNLSISSEQIHFHEIIAAINNMNATTTEQPATTTDTTTTGIPFIVVPKNIDFDFNLNVAQLNFGALTAEKIKGLASVRNGTLSLQAFDLETLGAKLHSELNYRNTSDKTANAFMELNLTEIDISSIGALIPSVDSLMPMLKSFKGMVDCRMVLVSPLNEQMSFDLNKLKGAIAIKGTSLILLDNETFRKLSQMLLFKNKKHNLIDSIGVDITIASNRIEVLPFEVSIDRYSAIIGGGQTFTEHAAGLDLEYKYNVSIMKSPLPFKAGVDIFGNMNNFDFKITKAKLKKTDFELQTQSFEAFREELIKNK